MTKTEKAVSLNNSVEKLKSVESISELHRLLQEMDLTPTLNQAKQVIENIENSMLETFQKLEANNTVTAETLGQLYSESMAKELSGVSLSLTEITRKAQSVGAELVRVLSETQEVLPNLSQEMAEVRETVLKVKNLMYLLGVTAVLNLSGIMFLALTR